MNVQTHVVAMADSSGRMTFPGDRPFALCLSHDVDRVRKTYQGLYYGLRDRSPAQFRSLFTDERPYWAFEEVMRLEEDLGVRSSFNFLNEKRLLRDKPPREWLDPRSWIRYNYYDVEHPSVRSVIEELADGGWEIGLQGSYDSYADCDRLAHEKSTLERLVGAPVRGGRQHFLNLSRPATWRHHREIGLGYDTSLGSGETIGFQHGYEVRRPFDDEFVVFPLTAMDQAVMACDDTLAGVRGRCERLVDEAAEHGAVMSVDWHQRVFNEREFPDWGSTYRHIVEYALERGAWVGPPGDLYDHLSAEDRDADRSVTTVVS